MRSSLTSTFAKLGLAIVSSAGAGLIAVILALATGAGASLVAAPASADTFATYQPGFLRQAERALARGAPQRALRILATVDSDDMKRRHRADARGMACRAQLLLGDFVAARDECHAAVDAARGQGSWSHFNNLGVAELNLGNYDAAETAFSKASSIGLGERTPRRNLSTLRALRDARNSSAGEQIALETR